MTPSRHTGRPFTTTLLVPTLNEITGMRIIMPLVAPSWVDQILVVDGGSTDGTVEYAQECGYDVIVQSRPGIRLAYTEALPLVRGDVVITFSPDGNSLPHLIPQLLDELQRGRDMVIASRYKAGAHSDDDDWLTAFGNWLFTRTVNVLHGGRYTDAMVIYRAYWKDLVTHLELDADAGYLWPEWLFGTRVSWEPLLSVRAVKQRLAIAEIPGDEPPRLGGTRKLQVFRWGAAYFFQFWWETLFWKRTASGPRHLALDSRPGSQTIAEPRARPRGTSPTTVPARRALRDLLIGPHTAAAVADPLTEQPVA